MLVLDTATVTVHMFDGDSLPVLRGLVEGKEPGQDLRRWMKFKIALQSRRGDVECQRLDGIWTIASLQKKIQISKRILIIS